MSLTKVNFTEVQINDEFWSPKLQEWKKNLIRVCLEKCYSSGRIDNFKKAAGLMKGEFKGRYFNDSDVYKVLEGAAYFLQLDSDSELEQEIDQIIEYIVKAQEDDGYIDTYYSLVEPTKKWQDMERHEMYCGGHLIEAAVAYYQATGKRNLLDVAIKMSDLYCQLFGEGKRHWVEGHQEIELALIKLYEVTSSERYLTLAKWLLEERGHGHGVGTIWNTPDWGPAYCQDDVPVKELREAKGHSVRAMYLYTAMTDLVMMGHADEYVTPLKSVWNDIIDTKMYITGGIGSTSQNEGFEKAYHLPNETAYCETCAAIGMVFWNQKMNQLTADAKYADIVELELYNNVLSGISIEGDKFFYVNPLESKGNHHREEWFETSCCPTNLARLLPSLGNYIANYDDDKIYINQFIGSKFEVGGTKVNIESKFPWQGKVKIDIESSGVQNRVIALRIPNWSNSFKVLTGSQDSNVSERNQDGYCEITLGTGSIEIDFEMNLKEVISHRFVKENEGKVALKKGPIVYCVEETDNSNTNFDQLQVPEKLKYHEINHRDFINVPAIVLSNQLILSPYYLWDNRDPGYMKVWLDKEEQSKLYQE